MKAANRVAMLWVFVMAVLAARNVSGQDCQWFLDWHGSSYHGHQAHDLEWRRDQLLVDQHTSPVSSIISVDYDNGVSFQFENGFCDRTMQAEVDEQWVRRESYSIGGTAQVNATIQGSLTAVVASASATAGSSLSFTGSLSVTNEYSITLRSSAHANSCERVVFRASTDVREVRGSTTYSKYKVYCRNMRTGQYDINTCGEKVFTCIAKGNVNYLARWSSLGINQACRDECNDDDEDPDDDDSGDGGNEGGGGSGNGCIDDYVEGDILLCGDYCGTLIGLFVTPQLGDILDPNPDDPCSPFETFDDIGFGIRLEVMVR